jgi:hypothetical protein
MTTDEAVQTVIIDKLKALIIENDMVATRALLNSVRYEKNESFNQLSYDIIALDYIVGLNDGIAPDEKPYPSIANLQKWIDAKGLDLNPYAVQNSIINNGTSWFRLGGSDIVTDSINAERFNEVIRLATPDIKDKIKNRWQLLFKNSR